MEKLLEILSGLNGDVDFTTAEGIIDNELIDSIDITSLISDIEDTFSIEIDMEEIVPENFNTVDAMWKLIQKLQG